MMTLTASRCPGSTDCSASGPRVPDREQVSKIWVAPGAASRLRTRSAVSVGPAPCDERDALVQPFFRSSPVQDVHALGALDERRELPARPVRQARLGRRAGPGQRQHPTPNRGRHLLPRCTPPPIQQPSNTAGREARQPQITVGRDTPANAATSTFDRSSARHNTIRVRVVATDADTSALFTSAANSAR
jgi:hypothetical protein